jgi:hypothetical protein
MHVHAEPSRTGAVMKAMKLKKSNTGGALKRTAAMMAGGT